MDGRFANSRTRHNSAEICQSGTISFTTDFLTRLRHKQREMCAIARGRDVSMSVHQCRLVVQLPLSGGIDSPLSRIIVLRRQSNASPVNEWEALNPRRNARGVFVR
jgi:hypothetical protein